jgi:hypothetical protein
MFLQNVRKKVHNHRAQRPTRLCFLKWRSKNIKITVYGLLRVYLFHAWQKTTYENTEPGRRKRDKIGRPDMKRETKVSRVKKQKNLTSDKAVNWKRGEKRPKSSNRCRLTLYNLYTYVDRFIVYYYIFLFYCVFLLHNCFLSNRITR